MPLSAGSRIGAYEVLGPLGVGGMGQVYRVRDPRLAREAALKVLGEGSSSDRDSLSRFTNEARTASALNHPNVVTIYEVGDAEGTLYIAMELVPGRSLRKVLDEGPVPLRAALGIAAQAAEGLAAAHERGIVHRDLKPENVMVTPDGLVKILDFGLAKKSTPPRHDDPTLAQESEATKPGTLIGTVGYMSPEQASGDAADFWSDQFAFGSILYELLSGRRAFQKTTGVETLTSILRDEPEPLTGIPAELQWILERCLAKLPRDRYGSTWDLAHDLARAKDRLSLPPLARAAPATARGAQRYLPALLAAAAVLALFVMGSRLFKTHALEPPRFRALTYSGRDFSPAVSPDGRTIAFTSDRDGRQRIWLKQLDTGAEVPLSPGPGDDNARFSPDGASVLYTRFEDTGTSLWRIPILGGDPRRLLDDARQGSFSPDGRRLAFVRYVRGDRPAYVYGLAAADGGGARDIRRIDAIWATMPGWSPDGRTIAITHGKGAAPAWETLVMTPEGENARELPPPTRFGRVSNAVFAPDGQAVVFAQTQSVFAGSPARFIRQEVRLGRADVLFHTLTFTAQLDTAAAGALVFDAQTLRGNLREVPLDHSTAGRWLTRGTSRDRQPFYAPRGERLVFSSNRDGNLDVWQVQPATGAIRRLTDDPADDFDPHVMADGRLLFSSRRTGHFEIWMAEADGTAPRQVSNDGRDAENPSATPDGAWIVYSSANPAKEGIWKLRPDGSDATHLASGTTGLPEVSPDGSLILFASFVPPTYTLRVIRLSDGQPLPFQIEGREDTRVFIRGRPRWMPDGKSIAFLDVDGAGRSGVFVQDFAPGRDTRSSRRQLMGFEPGVVAESFAIAPDASRAALASVEETSQLVLVEGLSGVGR